MKGRAVYRKGQVLNGKYMVQRILGQGGTSAVYLCTSLELGNQWAVKHVTDKRVAGKVTSEIEVLKKLNHTNLPKIAGMFSNEQGLFIVESYIEGIPLDRLLRSQGNFGAERVVDWSIQLCDIFAYLHGIKPVPIIYRDMKPSNIIISPSGSVVLVDFGISKEYRGLEKPDACMAGTGAYAAPEQFIKGGITDQRTDIYNLGVTMYQMLHGRLPRVGIKDFAGKRSRALMKLDAIIAKCLQSRKEDRYQRVEEIKEQLETVRDMLIVSKARQKLLLKLETGAAAVLSLVSYIAAILGLME